MTRQKAVSKVLELKGFTKEQLESEVRAIRDKLNSEQTRLDALEQSYKKTSDELADRQLSNTMPVQELNLFYAYLKHLTKQTELQKQLVAIRARELDEKQQAMIEAHKERRLVEILYDKIVRTNRKEADRDEQKEADSSYLTRKAGG